MKLLRLAALAAMFAVMLVGPAVRATVLFASGEDTGFTEIVGATGGAAGETGSSYLARSGFARNTSTVVAAFNSNNVADPPASRLQTPTFTSVSTLWIHAQFDILSSVANTSGQQALIVRSPDGVSRIVFRQTGTSGQLKMSTRNAAATFTDLATASALVPLATLTQLDIEIIYGCTSGDQINVWYGGVSVMAFTGSSICTDSATSLNQVELGSLAGASAGTVSNAGTGWSEVIIADQDTRGMALWTLTPNAAGNTQSWTPNTDANVNKAVINDATNVSTSASSAISEWTTPTSAPSGSWNVLAVVQEARVLRGTSGPQNFEWITRTIDGTDHTTGSVNPSTTFGNFSNQLWATNPFTGVPWVISDIASGFNLGIESLP